MSPAVHMAAPRSAKCTRDTSGGGKHRKRCTVDSAYRGIRRASQKAMNATLLQQFAHCSFSRFLCLVSGGKLAASLSLVWFLMLGSGFAQDQSPTVRKFDPSEMGTASTPTQRSSTCRESLCPNLRITWPV